MLLLCVYIYTYISFDNYYFDLINRAMLSYRDCRSQLSWVSLAMSLGESWYGDITGLPRPTARRSSALGIFLPSARGENARDLSAHMKKKTFKGDCQTDHFSG